MHINNFIIGTIFVVFGIMIFLYFYFSNMIENQCSVEKYATEEECMQFLTDHIYKWLFAIAFVSISINLIY